RISRLDGPDKVSGRAKYSYDIKRPEMLFGKILRSPYAHAKIVSIDTSAAEKMPGVKAVKVINGPGFEIQYAGAEIVAVAAVGEPTAEDAGRAIKVQFEKLPHVVNELDRTKVPASNLRPVSEKVEGDPDKGFKEAEVVIEGFYGTDVIAHCCLEAHGLVTEWTDDKNVFIHPSTQAVSTVHNDLAKALNLPAGNIHTKMDHVGGGFGSKFQIDIWGIEMTKVSQQAGGKPVKYFLDRDAEVTLAGSRPSAYAKVKV